MSKRPALFTEADINRAFKVAGKCPYPVIVEVKSDRTIRFVPVQNNVDSGESRESAVDRKENTERTKEVATL